jgi:5-methylcytosine-specific restriction protein A
VAVKLTRLGFQIPLADLRRSTAVLTPSKFADTNRGSRHERGYGYAWDKLRARILKRDGYVCRCAECRELDRLRPAHDVDHIIQRADGGSDDPSNLQAINRECHRLKTAREANTRSQASSTDVRAFTNVATDPSLPDDRAGRRQQHGRPGG